MACWGRSSLFLFSSHVSLAIFFGRTFPQAGLLLMRRAARSAQVCGILSMYLVLRTDLFFFWISNWDSLHVWMQMIIRWKNIIINWHNIFAGVELVSIFSIIFLEFWCNHWGQLVAPIYKPPKSKYFDMQAFVVVLVCTFYLFNRIPSVQFDAGFGSWLSRGG